MDRPAVKQWFAKQDWTPATARKVQVVMSSILSEGVELGVLRDNPAARLKLASQPRHTMVVLTAQEVRALAEATAQRSGRPADGLAVLTAAYTGLRAGELWALQAQDLIAGDNTQPRLLVRRTLTTANGTLVFRHATKTGNDRVVSLPAFLARDLQRHTQHHQPTDLIFHAPEGRPVRHELFTARVFRPVVKGQPATPARPKTQAHPAQPARPAVPSPLPPSKRGLRWHDLRHTCASLLISNGASIMLVSQRLGHASARMTLDRYAHLYPSEEQALAVQLDQAHAQAAQPQLHAVDGQDTVTS